MGSGAMRRAHQSFVLVMAGLVPAIHDFLNFKKQDVDARHKLGHDAAHCWP